MDWVAGAFDAAQQWVFENTIQPLLFMLGWGGILETGYVAAGWLLAGTLQIIVICLVIGPLQKWKPVEPVVNRAAIRVDVLYTLIHRLGVFRVAVFFLLAPVMDSLFGALRLIGFSSLQLDGLVPGVTDIPWISLLIYLIVFDFVDYWIHRGQHHFEWWWKLHALHHSQQQVTMWTDNRNHLLDDVLRAIILAFVAQCIGVAPTQFIAIVAITQLSESFQHANLRVWFGSIGERLWISPRFHRRHHSIGIGHETVQSSETGVPNHSAGTSKVVLGGHNFGVLLPWWDMLMGTANFELRYDPTGVRDQVEPDANGHIRNYGQGFWSQQWLGICRLLGRA